MGRRLTTGPRCAYGGPAPCVDDLCHGAHVTLCGIDLDFEREMGALDDDAGSHDDDCDCAVCRDDDAEPPE
jgi:hypothetical protein